MKAMLQDRVDVNAISRNKHRGTDPRTQLKCATSRESV